MTKSAIFVFLSSYFKKELVSWYASMQKFKQELDQFGALVQLGAMRYACSQLKVVFSSKKLQS